MTTHSKAHWFLFSTNHVVWKRHSQECIKSITAIFLVSENHVKKKERHSSCLVNIFLTQKERNALEVLIGTAFYISYSACATNERSSFATTWVHRPGSWSNVWIKARFWFSFYLVFLSGKSRVLQTDKTDRRTSLMLHWNMWYLLGGYKDYWISRGVDGNLGEY